MAKISPPAPTASVVQVADFIEKWLHSNSRIFHNEMELQLYLALHLNTDPAFLGLGYEVCLEYPVPASVTKRGNMDVDIVLHHKATDKYILLELKYKTVSKGSPMYYPFGGTVAVPLLSDHLAKGRYRYQYWKDVWRIEFLKRMFPKIEGGIALFLTNDTEYQNPPKSRSGWAAFTMHNGAIVGPGMLSWAPSCTYLATTCPAFSLSNAYKVDWRHITTGTIPFHYCMELI